jgi:hypothetical protein
MAVKNIMARLESEEFPNVTDEEQFPLFEKAIHWRMRQLVKTRHSKPKSGK